MINVEKEVKLTIKAHERCSGSGDHEDFTRDEIDAFPLEMRCCFFLQGWNKSIDPQTIDEWAELVGWLDHNIDACFHECAVRTAKEVARSLLAFVQRTITLERYK